MVVGLVGAAALAANGLVGLDEVVGAVFYGVAANVFYLLGPVGEMYLNWLADMGQQRILPAWVVGMIRSPLVTWVLILGGTGFSVMLTLIIGLNLKAPPM